MNEKILIEKIQNGDRKALDEFIEELYPVIYDFLNCRLNQDPYANDLAQEVFLKFMKHIINYQNEGHVKSYLYMIDIKLSNNYFRKRKREIVDDVYISYQANETDFSKEFIEDTSNQIAVKNLMDKLPDDQKVVV